MDSPEPVAEALEDSAAAEEEAATWVREAKIWGQGWSMEVDIKFLPGFGFREFFNGRGGGGVVS